MRHFFYRTSKKYSRTMRAIRYGATVTSLILYLFPAWGFAQGIPKGQFIVVKGGNYPQFAQAVEGFWERMAQAGYVRERDSKEYVLTPKEQKKVLEEIRVSRPSLIFTVGNSATKAVKESFSKVVFGGESRGFPSEARKRATAGVSDVPIVFAMVLAPVKYGILKDAKTPEQNISGVTVDIPIRKQVEKLRLIFPKTQRIGIIYSRAGVNYVSDIINASKETVVLETQLIRETDDIVAAFQKMKIDLFWMIPDRFIFTPDNRKRLFLSIRKKGIPIYAPTPKFLQGKYGADVALTVDAKSNGKQAAEIAIQFLNGKNKIPLRTPEDWILYAKKGRGIRKLSNAILIK